MACNCRGRSKATFVWTDGVTTIIYSSETAAKAKVIRKGGTYTRRE